MADRRDEFQVRSVSTKSVGRAVPILTFLVGIFLGAALVKPWDLIFPPSSPVLAIRPSASDLEPSTRPTTEPSPAPTECAYAGGWRVFALGRPDAFGGDGSVIGSNPSPIPSQARDIESPLRRWIEVAPLEAATGPDDPRVPFVTIVSDRIAGISYCPPRAGNDSPPAASSFTAWRLDEDAGSRAMTLRQVTIDSTKSVGVPVYIGVGEPDTVDASWPPGRYVFAVGSSNDSGYERWFGVEIRYPPGRLGG